MGRASIEPGAEPAWTVVFSGFADEKQATDFLGAVVKGTVVGDWVTDS